MSRPLLMGGLAEIRERIGAAPTVSLFLSFDGALAPTVEDPAEARIETQTWKLLEALSKRPDILTVIVSGRSLTDLQTRVAIDDIVYAGNHGLEIGGKGFHFVEPFAAARGELLARISESLAANLKGIFGVRVEYKRLTTSVHYRQAAMANLRDVERTVQAVVAPNVSPFFIDAGKMVLEVIPRTDWHKGAAVCWINSRLAGKSTLSIYIGDDRTDESAFRRLSDDLTICVGNPEWSSAQYYVASCSDVREFLLWLIGNRQTPPD